MNEKLIQEYIKKCHAEAIENLEWKQLPSDAECEYRKVETDDLGKIVKQSCLLSEEYFNLKDNSCSKKCNKNKARASWLSQKLDSVAFWSAEILQALRLGLVCDKEGINFYKEEILTESSPGVTFSVGLSDTVEIAVAKVFYGCCDLMGYFNKQHIANGFGFFEDTTVEMIARTMQIKALKEALDLNNNKYICDISTVQTSAIIASCFRISEILNFDLTFFVDALLKNKQAVREHHIKTYGCKSNNRKK